MKRTSFARWPCSIARTMDIVGDAWTPLVLREALYGIRKFDEFQTELGIARNTLTERLRILVDEGLLEKRQYADSPRRYEYVLTEKGKDFFPVLLAVSRWGDRWLSGEEGPPVTFHHATCGSDTHVAVVCAVCGEPMLASDTSSRMGPGYPRKLARRASVRRRFARSGATADEGQPKS